jgi:hypothetical protein
METVAPSLVGMAVDYLTRYALSPLKEDVGWYRAERAFGMLRLMWPNPDRHGGAERRVPELGETAGVVHLAVAIVQWARDGLIT